VSRKNPQHELISTKPYLRNRPKFSKLLEGGKLEIKEENQATISL